MASPNTNPTPRQQFQESKDNISKHRAMIESGEFQRAIHFSLLQLDRTLCDQMPQDLGGAGANFLRSQGARMFVETLLRLAEMPPPLPAENRILNLDHKRQ